MEVLHASSTKIFSDDTLLSLSKIREYGNISILSNEIK
jgi:hypothetical protein